MTNPISKLFSVKTAGAMLLAVAAMTSTATADTNTPAISRTGDKLSDLLGDPVVAKGKGVEVKRSQIDEIMVNYKANLAAGGQVASAVQLRFQEQRVLNNMIGVQLLLSRATDDDRKKGQAELDSALKKYKASAKVTDAEFEEKLALQLRGMGATRAQWDKERSEQATLSAVLDRELKVVITDEQVKKFYDEHPSQFEEPERVRVSHILLGTKDPTDTNRDPAMRRDLPEDRKLAKRKQLEALIKRARSGEDFNKLAREFSEDPGVKENGGEYTFARGDQLAPQFKAAAFSLSTNQVSDVVETVFGYHILKLLEKIPAKKLELAGTVAERVKEGLKQQELQKLVPGFIEKLEKEAGVEILDEKLKPSSDDLAAPVKPGAGLEKK